LVRVSQHQGKPAVLTRRTPALELVATSEAEFDLHPSRADRLKARKSGTAWRHANVGRLLNNAVRRFEARVLELMSAKGHVATRMAHIGLTRNLDVEGTRLTELARRASISKQAMGELVDQCAALKLVDRVVDPDDRRGRIVRFTPAGLTWLDAFSSAVDIAEKEMRTELGKATMDALLRGLEVYGAAFDTLAD